MMTRYLPLIAHHGGQAVAVCRPELMKLFEAMGLEVANRSGAIAIPAGALFCPYMSLPLALRLFAPPPPIAPVLEAKPSGARIGIRTSGHHIHPFDHLRSLDAEAAMLMRSVPGTIDLDPEVTGASDFLETAEIIADLDLVITVDTSVAHLSGAMGKPTYIMLPHRGVDWRWGLSGQRTAWYPSARLWRQRPNETWSDVVRRLLLSL